MEKPATAVKESVRKAIDPKTNDLYKSIDPRIYDAFVASLKKTSA